MPSKPINLYLNNYLSVRLLRFTDYSNTTCFVIWVLVTRGIYYIKSSNALININMPLISTFSIVYFTLLFLVYYNVFSKLSSYYKYKEVKQAYYSKLFFCITFSMITLLVSIYYLGQFVQAEKVNRFISGNLPVKVANIQTDSVTSSTYMLIDLNKDMFLGFNEQNKIVIIPTNKIKSIEISENR